MKLPHSSSLRYWTSTVDINPGFLSKVLEELKKLSCEDKDCCLIFDAMSIRKQLCWSEVDHKYVGYCDYGNNFNFETNETEATEALVFMLVNIKGKWKCPIAYFFKNGMQSTTLAELIKTALILTSNVNLKVRAITCDGVSVNISALHSLGCKLLPNNHEDIVNYFDHPSEHYKVYIILDPCHMLKLARNALADYTEFWDEHKSIKWNYIVNLHKVQNQMTYKLKNKLNSQCIFWQQNKMKVKYAAHTLSASVANAIDFLRKEGLDDFKDSESTTKFIRIIDRLFDFLNTRNPFGKNFKQPITRINFHYLQEMIQESIHYLFLLKCKDGTFLKTSNRRTFLYGFVIAAKSILSVAQDLLFCSNTLYKYILSYKFSQDHLELLFGKIRNCNGQNNNPNVLQFQYTMRKLLLRNNIRNSSNTNCLQLDTDPVGSLFELTWPKKTKEFTLFEQNIETDNDDLNNNTENSKIIIEPLQENIIYYIGGYIIRTFKSLKCFSCAEALTQQTIEHNYTHTGTYTKFYDFNNNGGLIRPSVSVYKVMLQTETQIRLLTNTFSTFAVKHLDFKIITNVKNALALDTSIFENLNCENVDLLEVPHKIKLITTVAQRYVKIRLHSYSKFYTQEILKPIKKRHRLTKQILFACE